MITTLRMGPAAELEPKPPGGQQTQEDRRRWVDHPGYGLVPQKIVSIFRSADNGYPQQQCDLFDDGVETDAHMRSQLETRRHAVAGKEWLIQAGGDGAEDKRAADMLEEAIRRAASFSSMIFHQLTAPWYGWAASEIMWGRFEGLYVPEWFVNVPHRRFVFDEVDDPLLVNEAFALASTGVELEPGRWIFGRMPGRLIAASGLLRTAMRLSFAKRLCMRDAVDASARLGMPIPLATYPIGYPEQEQGKALAFVEMISRGGRGYGAMGDGVEIKFPKAEFGGSENFWVNLVSLLNSEISKLITGATLTSGEGTSAGSYALGAVHENVAYQIVKSDAKWIGDLFERYVGRPFCVFNGLNARPPRLKFHLVLQEDPSARVAVMRAFIDMGGRIDLDQAQQELQFKQVTGPFLGAPDPEPAPAVPAPGLPSAPGAVPANDDEEPPEPTKNSRRLRTQTLGDPDQPRDDDGKWGSGGGGSGSKSEGGSGGASRERAAAKFEATVGKEKARLHKEDQRLRDRQEREISKVTDPDARAELEEDHRIEREELDDSRNEYKKAVVEGRATFEQPEIKAFYEAETYEVDDQLARIQFKDEAPAYLEELHATFEAEGVKAKNLGGENGTISDWEGHPLVEAKHQPTWFKKADSVEDKVFTKFLRAKSELRQRDSSRLSFDPDQPRDDDGKWGGGGGGGGSGSKSRGVGSDGRVVNGATSKEEAKAQGHTKAQEAIAKARAEYGDGYRPEYHLKHEEVAYDPKTDQATTRSLGGLTEDEFVEAQAKLAEKQWDRRQQAVDEGWIDPARTEKAVAKARATIEKYREPMIKADADIEAAHAPAIDALRTFKGHAPADHGDDDGAWLDDEDAVFNMEEAAGSYRSAADAHITGNPGSGGRGEVKYDVSNPPARDPSTFEADREAAASSLEKAAAVHTAVAASTKGAQTKLEAIANQGIGYQEHEANLPPLGHPQRAAATVALSEFANDVVNENHNADLMDAGLYAGSNGSVKDAAKEAKSLARAIRRIKPPKAKK